jgi:hypothetical protein
VISIAAVVAVAIAMVMVIAATMMIATRRSRLLPASGGRGGNAVIIMMVYGFMVTVGGRAKNVFQCSSTADGCSNIRPRVPVKVEG